MPEIIITSCNSWKGATPTLGGRERGRAIDFFFFGGGQSIIIIFLGFFRVGWAGDNHYDYYEYYYYDYYDYYDYYYCYYYYYYYYYYD